jgi:ferredoxin
MGRTAADERAADRFNLGLAAFEALLQTVRAAGYRLLGPTLRDGAIVLAEIEGMRDLPAGWTEVQGAGTYRLERRSDAALFGYSLGPQSWKPQFFVPRLRLWRARRDGNSFAIEDEQAEPPPRLALLGARSCDLHALAIQDRVFAQGKHPDPDYVARRADTLILAVNCGQAGGTCFCVSMQTGPRVTTGFDLALTEILDGEHRFLVEVGSRRGAELLAAAGKAPAGQEDVAAADALVERTAASMGRRLDTTDIKAVLYERYEHPQWESVAERCLSCANCTLVCPTCFCSTVEDVTDLTGEHAERWRRWDSCFTTEHSHLHGGSARSSIRSRYRQWLVHKLATWIDQYGTSGCVGCGRCVTWCPVGIDLTAEMEALRQTPAPSRREEAR